MAASTAAFATSGSAVLAPARDAAALSSNNAFGTSLVQLTPVRSSVKQSNHRLVATRAGLSEEQKTAGKKVLASFLATGAALSIAGQALAGNPIDFAKSKADEIVSGAQDATSNFPNLPSIDPPKGGDAQDMKSTADGLLNGAKTRIDGIFGKNKPYPQNRVASSNGGTGSAIGDAKKRISKVGAKNPIAENVKKGTDDSKNTIAQARSGSVRAGKEFLGQDSTRVDEATRKAKNVGDSLKKKAGNAVNDAKDIVGSAQSSTPDLPNLFNPLEGAQGLKEKAADVKDNVSSNLPNAPNLPNLPNPLEGLTGGKDKAVNAKGNVASKAAGLKGNISKKPI